MRLQASRAGVREKDDEEGDRNLSSGGASGAAPASCEDVVDGARVEEEEGEDIALEANVRVRVVW